MGPSTRFARQRYFPAARNSVPEPEWSRRDTVASDATSDLIEILARKVEVVDDGWEIFPGVTADSASGHTPEHSAYVVTFGGARLVAFGDAMHTPLQVENPNWTVPVDTDREHAQRSRERLVAELQEPNTLGFGAHFADVVFGWVQAEGDRFTWNPETSLS